MHGKVSKSLRTSVCRSRFIHLSRHIGTLIAMLLFSSTKMEYLDEREKVREEKGNNFQIFLFSFFFLLQYAVTLASKDSPLSKLLDSIADNVVCHALLNF